MAAFAALSLFLTLIRNGDYPLYVMGRIDSELNGREGREAQKPNSYSLVCIFLLAFVICRNMAGQIMVDNPAKPSRKDASRAVLLEEVFRIKDDGEKIIFKGQIDMAFSDDGALFFLAYNHLFKFSPSGQFIFKTIKEGEGPGECRQATRFFFMDGRMRVLSFAPPKVLDYDHSGRYLKEAKIRVPHRIYFLSFIDGKIYGIQDEIAYSDDIHKEGLSSLLSGFTRSLRTSKR